MAKVDTALFELKTSPENIFTYQEIYLHMIFNIKLGDKFSSKSSIFAVRNKTKAPS